MRPRIANPLQKWQEYFSVDSNPSLTEQFQSIYGDNPRLTKQQQNCYVKMLAHFRQLYGNQESVVIARAPGRVNLVGMHIDHQGGAVNPIAIKETRVIAQPRTDDQIRLANCDGDFQQRSFRISEILPKQSVDWSSWSQQITTQRQRDGVSVDWTDYVKAALIVLQERERGRDGGYAKNLCGMNLLVDSDLPVAAGLSSSSALVVATAYTVIACNDLRYEPVWTGSDSITSEGLIELLGESERYVGLHGGIGDHAVIVRARCGHLSHIQLLPTHVEYAPFPPDYCIVVCHSGITAKKSAGAQNTYNERVASYAIGGMLLKKKYSQTVRHVERFRDFYPEFLGISISQLYQMLKTLPIRATRAELAEWLPEHRQELDTVYQSHREESGGYRLRGVCLYGMAECERSRRALEFLRQGDIQRFGQLINLSHEGDRVFINGDVPFTPDISDAYLDGLIGLCENRRACAENSSEGGRALLPEAAELYQQPGGYAASCKELDALVDTARRVRGVHGAGLIGAGLGGCISILVKAETVEELIDTLHNDYYAKYELPSFVEVCTPAAGACLLRLKVT